MDLKDTELEFAALFSQAVHGHGFANYGYWPHGNPSEPTLRAIGDAQQCYFEHLAAQIPIGVRSVLDVGSGTGANAVELAKLGYEVECVCPSEQLNQMARSKIPPANVHTATFEAFECHRMFDLCLFAESFHYIDLDAALAQTARYAKRNALIFDYFRRAGGAYEDGTRGTHKAFLCAVAKRGDFTVRRDIDETETILPTSHVLDHLKDRNLAPFVRRFRAELKKSHPIYSFFAELFLKRRLAKLEAPGTRHAKFAEKHEYRLILLERTVTID